MELEKAPLRFAFVSCFPLLQASTVGPECRTHLPVHGPNLLLLL